MRSTTPFSSLALLACAVLPGGLGAQTLISQWDFNGMASGSFYLPTAGTYLSGAMVGYGQARPSTPLSSNIMNGTRSDPGTLGDGGASVGTHVYNRAATVNPPIVGAANGSVGVVFTVSTEGMAAGEAVQVSFSQTLGFRSSRYWQILVSTSGTLVGTPGSQTWSGTFSAPVGGIGSTITQSVVGLNSANTEITGTATVVVNSSGMVDFRTIEGNWISQAVTYTISGGAGTIPSPLAAGFVDNITYTLPTGMGYENNPNLALALVGLWDPSYTGSLGSEGLVSSYAGTNSSDTTNGYNRTLGAGGSMRLDLFSVYATSTAVPEPSTYGLAFGLLALASVAVRRRARRHGGTA